MCGIAGLVSLKDGQDITEKIRSDGGCDTASGP